jgi:hypothetical protein
MSSEPRGRNARRQQNARLFPSQVVRPQHRRDGSADVRVLNEHVYITLHLPHIEDAELRYSIRRRYMLVWGEGSPHEAQILVHLPKAVDGQHHSVRFHNGVFDAKIRLREAPK